MLITEVFVCCKTMRSKRFEKRVRFYIVKLVGANLGWIFLHRATIYSNNFNKPFFVSHLYYYFHFLLIYSLTEAAGRMKSTKSHIWPMGRTFGTLDVRCLFEVAHKGCGIRLIWDTMLELFAIKREFLAS